MTGAVIEVIGWCLLHFVWQATLVAGGYALVRALVPRGNARYLAAVAAMALLAALPVATGLHEYRLISASVPWATPMTMVASPIPAASGGFGLMSWEAWFELAMPWLVFAWAGVVLLLATRVAREWLRLRTIVAAAIALPEWQSRARALGARMGLSKLAPVLASAQIAAPALVGWLRPAIVLPLSVLSGMPPVQIDLVLAHELAHLKRLDHVVNLFQVTLETLFFYHPAVRWISREARDEREVCCDAMALRAAGGARRDFIEALASLAELGSGGGELAVAADGGALIERATFIAGAATESRRAPLSGGLVAALALAAVIIGGAMWEWHATLRARLLDASVVASDAAAARNLVAGVAADGPSVTVSPLAPALRQLPLVTASQSSPDADGAVLPAAPPEVAIDVAAPRLRPVDLSLRVPSFAAASPAQDPIPAPSSAAIAPVPLHEVAPVYPAGAMLQGLQGQVVVEFGLSAGGVPQDLEVVNSAAGALDEAALLALSQWRFVPATGSAAHRYRQSFAFRLGDGASAGPGPGTCLVRTGTHICRQVSGTPAATDGRVSAHP